MNGKIACVVSQLRFLGKIKAGEKLSLGSLCLRSNNIYTRIVRTTRTYILQDENECRKATYNYIQNTFDEAFELLPEITSADSYLFPLVIQAINEALTGIKNLTTTYANDALFVSEIETAIEIYGARLKERTAPR